MEHSELKKIAADLEAVKKLMILSLVQRGIKQTQLAAVLGVSDATLSLMFPKGLLKEAKGHSEDD
jgi:DNA-binding Xre family transcriptional regulator